LAAANCDAQKYEEGRGIFDRRNMKADEGEIWDEIKMILKAGGFFLQPIPLIPSKKISCLMSFMFLLSNSDFLMSFISLIFSCRKIVNLKKWPSPGLTLGAALRITYLSSPEAE
jgi:hypothetical protein